jgi:integrase/recombinase XerD
VADEMVFKTTSERDRLMLELMARGGMHIGEVLKLTLAGVDGKKLRLIAPKSGRPQEHVHLPQKLANRSNLATTQIYLGKVSGEEAFKWVEVLHG